MFLAVLLLIIRRYYSVYTAIAICHALRWLAANNVGMEKEGCIYSYGTVYFTCNSISSFVGRTVCSIHTVLLTRLLILMHVKYNTS
jgi:hypothetical protein